VRCESADLLKVETVSSGGKMRASNWPLISLLFLFGYGTTSTAIPITGITFAQTSSTVVSGNGLSLTLAIDSTSYQPGQQISITIAEKNTLATKDSIEAANAWFVQGLNMGPCVTKYPFGISILQGNYDTTNVASITPLNLYDPNVVIWCPVGLSVTAYDFQPSSDTAVIYSYFLSSTGNSWPPWSMQMIGKVSSTGYWAGNRPAATFINFTPGIYTVVGGDEWGALVILHFTVTPATAVTSPHQKLNLQARVIPQGCAYNIRGALVSSSGRRGQIPGIYFIKSGGTGLFTVIR
jgi:hypothetical protein